MADLLFISGKLAATCFRPLITLICPNPQEIAFGSEVQIYEGEGPLDGPTQVIQCGKNWRFGSECACEHQESLDCRSAKIRRRKQETIQDVSDREWRIYCRDGGYVAAGDGIDRIVLLPDSWTEVIGQVGSSAIIDQLTGTLRPRSTIHSK